MTPEWCDPIHDDVMALLPPEVHELDFVTQLTLWRRLVNVYDTPRGQHILALACGDPRMLLLAAFGDLAHGYSVKPWMNRDGEVVDLQRTWTEDVSQTLREVKESPLLSKDPTEWSDTDVCQVTAWFWAVVDRASAGLPDGGLEGALESGSSCERQLENVRTLAETAQEFIQQGVCVDELVQGGKSPWQASGGEYGVVDWDVFLYESRGSGEGRECEWGDIDVEG